jgi:hypothetical protein
MTMEIDKAGERDLTAQERAPAVLDHPGLDVSLDEVPAANKSHASFGQIYRRAALSMLRLRTLKWCVCC